MRLDEIFISTRGHDLDRRYLEAAVAPEGCNYVSRISGNNGVSGRFFIPPAVDPFPAGALTVALGSRNYALATFLQPEPFLTGQNIQVLQPIDAEMPTRERLWWGACITANRYRFGFGRYANRTLDSIELPDAPPKWVLESRTPELTLLDDVSDASLVEWPGSMLDQLPRWDTFLIDSLFDVRKGSRLTQRERRPGSTVFIAATMLNNGWADRISSEPKFPALSITVPYNGSVGYAFLQPVPYCASDDVNVLISREDLNVGALLFVCAIIRNERYRFSYARKWNLERFRKSTLHLPITHTGQPDWSAMDKWIASRPFSRMAIKGPTKP